MKCYNSYTVIGYFPERSKGGHKGVYRVLKNVTLETAKDFQKMCETEKEPAFMKVVPYFKNDSSMDAIDRDPLFFSHSKLW